VKIDGMEMKRQDESVIRHRDKNCEKQAQLNSQERSRHYAVGRCIDDV
jgi:hypothetical protein